MGIIKPTWVDESWFNRCPFNYCDHFGDKQVLRKVCKICDDEVIRLTKYKKLGLDPFDIDYVLKEISDTFRQILKDLKKNSKKWQIDLDNLPDISDADPDPETYAVYRMLVRYNLQVSQLVIQIGKLVQKHPHIKFLKMTFDVLAHSQLFILAKTARALDSRREEDVNTDLLKNSDAKTSALFVYLAIERNSLAVTALSKYIKMIDTTAIELREFLLEFADLGHDVAELVKQEFFPCSILDFKEIGIEEYEQTFLAIINDKPVVKHIN